MYLVLCKFIKCVGECTSDHSQGRTVPSAQGPVLFPFINLTHSSSLTLQLLLCPPVLNFVILNMSHKWKHTVRNLWDWLLALSISLWRFTPLCMSIVPLQLSSIRWQAHLELAQPFAYRQASGLIRVPGGCKQSCYKESAQNTSIYLSVINTQQHNYWVTW